MGTNTGREYLVMRNLSKATLQGLSALLGASRNLEGIFDHVETMFVLTSYPDHLKI